MSAGQPTGTGDGGRGGNGGAGNGGPSGLDALIALMARLPGLGPRSARRAALHLARNRETLLAPLAEAFAEAAATIRPCETCGNISAAPVCSICADPRRDGALVCVVADVADLWAMERGGAFRGRYHVLGGLLSALDGVGPEDLGIPALAARVQADGVREAILALPATVDGQTTAHVVADHLRDAGAEVTTLAQGVPVGGELDFLDDGTISAALRARRAL
ncbi:recombination mediator RecR [Rhodovulum sp. DZ06]|uniref:recombination mediator RecR n=1 Tax=Rhodovulum sp. DZ06 TaxID=3425126 RepID=UPI003D357D4A